MPYITTNSLSVEKTTKENIPLHSPRTVANCPYDTFVAALLALNENECHSALFNLRGRMVENIRRIKENPHTDGARAIVSGIRFLTYCPLPDLPEPA